MLEICSVYLSKRIGDPEKLASRYTNLSTTRLLTNARYSLFFGGSCHKQPAFYPLAAGRQQSTFLTSEFIIRRSVVVFLVYLGSPTLDRGKLEWVMMDATTKKKWGLRIPAYLPVYLEMTDIEFRCTSYSYHVRNCRYLRTCREMVART